MWPYVVLIVCPILVQHIRLDDRTLYIARVGSKRNEIAMILFWTILLMLLILRHETVGVDLENYTIIFKYIQQSSWSKGMARSTEVAYSLLNKVVSLYTDNFRWVIASTAVLGVWFVAKAYINYSTDAALTIVLFIITSNFILLFSGLRQAIAISLGLVAFEQVRARSLIRFLAVVFLGMLFHTSAFMLLFMYPIYHARITKKWLIVVVPLLGVLYVFNRQIFGYLTVILSMFTEYEAVISSTGAYTMLMLFILFAVFSYVIPDDAKLDGDTIGLRNFLLLAIALQMFALWDNVAMRMNYYYIVFIPLLIPRIIEHRSFRWNQVALVARNIMVVFFIVFFFISVSKDNSLNTFPYHFFWENV